MYTYNFFSRRRPVVWPSSSRDLKLLAQDALEESIWRVITDIRLQLLQKVFENGASRLELIRVSSGGHVLQVSFKT